MKIGSMTGFVWSSDDIGDFVEDIGLVIDYWENIDLEEMFVTILCGSVQHQVPERHCFEIRKNN